MNLESMSADDLRTLLANHERLNRTDAETYSAAKAELERRDSKMLDIDVTRAAILRSAKKRRFITYGDLAKENGVVWSKAYRPIAQHLDEVMRVAYERGEPLITSIVVNEAGRQTGVLDDNSLKGFVEGAKRLGLAVPNAQLLLREQQRLTFDYALRATA